MTVSATSTYPLQPVLSQQAPTAAQASGTATFQALQANSGNPLAIAQILQQNNKNSPMGEILQAVQASESENSSLALLQGLQPANSSIYNVLMTAENPATSLNLALLSAAQHNQNGTTPDVLDTLLRPATEDQTGTTSNAGDGTDFLDSLIHPTAAGTAQTIDSPSTVIANPATGGSDLLGMLLDPSTGTIDLSGVPNALQNIADASGAPSGV